MADPDEAPGLAHFLEHMLFLGTEKYPVENAYSAFLNSHGGHSNAYTSQENTVYYFDIQNEAFEEAIDMFASFFTCPLFNESATEREIIAVDNENTKNLQADNWRCFQLLKSLAREDHPFHKFSTGNKDTLETKPLENNLRIHEMLLEFYNRYYSANIMKFVLYGSVSLDELQKWAVEKLSNVVNKDLSRVNVPNDPYPSSILPKYLEVLPVKDLRVIDIQFPLPEVESLYLAKPTRYLTHLIGHESDGSILAALKEKGYANGLSTYMSQSFKDFAAMGCSIEVTEAGVDHVDEIVECVFAYIGMLNREGPKEWIYQEQIDTQAMNFRYISKSEPSSYCINMANNMQTYPADKLITGSALTFQIDLPALTSMMSYLTPSNAIIMWQSKIHEDKTDKKEKWYGTNHTESKPNEKQLAAWNAAMNTLSSTWSKVLKLPKVNTFLPTDFTCRYKGKKKPNLLDESRQIPFLLEKEITNIPIDTDNEQKLQSRGVVSSPNGRKLCTWYMADKKWLIPKTNVLIKMETMQAYASPMCVVMTDMFANILEEHLIELSYYADCAGLHYSIRNSTTGLDLTVYGFHHKLPLLVSKVIEGIKDLSVMSDDKAAGLEEVYNRIKERLLLSYQNVKFSQPYMHCIISATECMEEPKWSVYEKLIALRLSTFTDFRIFTKTFLRALNTEMFVHGNASIEDAKSLSKNIQDILSSLPLPFSESPTRRLVLLGEGTSYVYRQHALHNNPDEVNSAVQNVYFLGREATITTNNENELGGTRWGHIGKSALLHLLCHMLSEPAFDQLRTKEQLGYIVHTATVKFTDYIGMRVIVQSNSKGADYLDERIESFLEGYKETLNSISSEDLASNIKAVKESLTEKPKSLQKETNHFWSEINSGSYLFNRNIKEAKFLETVKLEDLVDFFDTFISPVSTTRVKFSSQFYGSDQEYPKVMPDGVQLIENPTSFKRSMPLLPCISNADLLKLEKIDSHCFPVPPYPYENDDDDEGNVDDGDGDGDGNGSGV